MTIDPQDILKEESNDEYRNSTYVYDILNGVEDICNLDTSRVYQEHLPYTYLCIDPKLQYKFTVLKFE